MLAAKRARTKSRELAPRVLLLVALAAFLCAGCTAAAPMAQPVRLSLHLDQDTYRIGEPVTALVRLHNASDETLLVPRFDRANLHFLVGNKGGATRVRREPVASREELPRPREAEPGAELLRRFLFTRLTEKEGEYGLIASVQEVAVGREILPAPVYSTPAAYSVERPVALRRDRNGMILKAQALELAGDAANGRALRSRAVLIPLGKTGLFTWVVLMWGEGEDGERERVVQVNPYTGRAEPLSVELPPALVSGADGAAAAAGPAEEVQLRQGGSTRGVR
jgi:hypothetical protein